MSVNQDVRSVGFSRQRRQRPDPARTHRDGQLRPHRLGYATPARTAGALGLVTIVLAAGINASPRRQQQS
ncbi:hypothetical protein GCM10022380_07600 [Amycolatopsis tucumanensis]|uniref:Uncharacterized protein n=1 Tax=Amycolatopsis tucumanensis TaxID=401106 RepID=A0ABP7HFS0_9PSEU